MHDDMLDDDHVTNPWAGRLAKGLGSAVLVGSLTFGAAACGDDDAEDDPVEVEDEVEDEVEAEVEEEIEQGEQIEDELEQELEEEIEE